MIKVGDMCRFTPLYKDTGEEWVVRIVENPGEDRSGEPFGGTVKILVPPELSYIIDENRFGEPLPNGYLWGYKEDENAYIISLKDWLEVIVFQ